MVSKGLKGRSVAVVVHDGRVLLVESKKAPGSWVPPGGTIEPREPAHEAAAREVMEETGVQVRIGHLIAYREIWWDTHDSLELYFAAAPSAQVAAGAPMGIEKRPARWQSVAELGALRHFPECLDELCRIATNEHEPVRHLGAIDLRDK